MKNCTVTLKNPLANVLAVITYTHTHTAVHTLSRETIYVLTTAYWEKCGSTSGLSHLLSGHDSESN